MHWELGPAAGAPGHGQLCGVSALPRSGRSRLWHRCKTPSGVFNTTRPLWRLSYSSLIFSPLLTPPWSTDECLTHGLLLTFSWTRCSGPLTTLIVLCSKTSPRCFSSRPAEEVTLLVFHPPWATLPFVKCRVKMSYYSWTSQLFCHGVGCACEPNTALITWLSNKIHPDSVRQIFHYLPLQVMKLKANRWKLEA